MKRGVILLNLGGPTTLKDVRPFLFRLFSDPAILVGVPAPIRILIAAMIALFKGASSIRNYAGIGGGSPQLRWTRAQADGLAGQMKAAGVDAKVTVGMRTSRPFIADGLAELKAWGADEVVVLPLFPQWSTTTTGTCFGEVDRSLARLARDGWNPRAVKVERWPDHPGYVSLLKRTLQESVAQAEADRKADGAEDEPIHILFSAHSLPLKIVERGDPYPQDVNRTVRAAAEGLTHPWSLAFQSRNGKMPWIQPYTEDALRDLGAQGIKRVVVVPVSFVSDHIETLYELDQEYAHQARGHGISRYYRTRAFNDDPEFARVLNGLIPR